MTLKKNPSGLKPGDLGGRSAESPYAFVYTTFLSLAKKYWHS
jgi:hypothetical protein